MKTKLFLTPVFISFLILLGSNIGFSQEENNIVVGPDTTTETPATPETQWVWGEVISVDTSKSQLNVKYLDYENDTEKEITITANDKTVFENVSSLEQLKAKDTVSVDYLVSADGVNLAKSISMEKPEESQGVTEAPKDESAANPPAIANPETTTTNVQSQAAPEQQTAPAATEKTDTGM